MVMGVRAPVFETGAAVRAGVAVLRTTTDLDIATAARGRSELDRFCASTDARWALLLLGRHRFVDHRGLTVLLDAARHLRGRGADLILVTPPHCVERMIEVLGVQDELRTADDVWSAATHVLDGRR